jgi:hypothetical protein
MPMHGVPNGIVNPPPTPPAKEPGSEIGGGLGMAPGTIILVFIFLAAFATYYFTNWKLLSFLWEVG